MPSQKEYARAAGFALVAWALVSGNLLYGQDAGETARQLRSLQEQNRILQEQLQRQQTALDELSRKIITLENNVPPDPTDPSTDVPPRPDLLTQPFARGSVILGGEGGVAFIHQGSDGQFPKSEFRVDEAKLFLDARIWEDVYLFSELNITLREEPNEDMRMGELYVDFEDLSELWGQERLLNLRAGRFDIPFGTEYLTRDAVDNPLVSHSLADFWGIDEGVELYGRWRKLQYVFAVQNGGHPALRDFNSDKSVTLRLGYDLHRRLRANLSAMRTGNLDVKDDKMSELWFGGGFIRALGAPATTTRYHAELVQADLEWTVGRGYLKGAGGYLHSDDNDSAADNTRHIYFYSVEAFHPIWSKWYGAARFSQIFADDGFPIVGNGQFGPRFFGRLTEDLWRLSLGVGYRWSSDLVFKLEYSLDRGHELGGRPRDQEDLLGAEVGFRF